MHPGSCRLLGPTQTRLAERGAPAQAPPRPLTPLAAMYTCRFHLALDPSSVGALTPSLPASFFCPLAPKHFASRPWKKASRLGMASDGVALFSLEKSEDCVILFDRLCRCGCIEGTNVHAGAPLRMPMRL